MFNQAVIYAVNIVVARVRSILESHETDYSRIQTRLHCSPSKKLMMAKIER